MQHFNKYLLLFAVFLFICGNTYAQFTLGAELRPRAEYRHGYRSLAAKDQEPNAFIDQRSRLNFGYSMPKMKLFVQFQDVRTWGSTSQLAYAVGSTTLHQAWGQFSIGKKMELRAGRQEWNYDAARILGNVNWAQQARSHDGVLLMIKGNKDLSLHLGGAFDQDAPGSVGTVYTTPRSYKSLFFLWVNKKFSDNFKGSILAMSSGLQPFTTDSAGAVDKYVDRYTQTLGTHLEYKKEKLNVTGWFYYQMGETPSFDHIDVQAMNASVELGYQANEQFKVSLGVEYLSGQSQTDTTASYSESQRSFAPLYGTNHKFNGFMDYFYVGNHAGSVGLLDPYLKFVYKKEKTTVGAAVHFFQSAADVLDKGEFESSGEIKSMSSALGTELDLFFGTTITDDVLLKAGYSQLFATETMQALKGGDYKATQNWGYVMLIFKPTLYKTPEPPKESATPLH